MGRRIGFAIAALAVLALAGCSADSNSTGGEAADLAAPQPQQAGLTPAQGKPVEPPGKAVETPKAEQPPTAGADRMLVRTAAVELRTADVTTVLGQVKDVALDKGGYPAQENSTQTKGTVTLRVPGDRLDAVLKDLRALPDTEVARQELKSEDVTEQVVDVEARLANQRASVERVRGLLERAGSTSEITQIEAELTKRQSELESLQRRYDTLKSQVAMSTLTVTVTQKSSVPVARDEDPTFLSALGGGWDALVGAVSWVLVVLGAVLPFAVVLGVPVVAYLVWRRNRRPTVVTPKSTTS
ncbi:DUF4349 domain-containing protein [Saccharothrix variisporea]|uniref:Uncharacterized protein DUF4349 n=1 Tax=Saccharothrix variisporea TaxID=543527 RepID=A0A495XD66_9PSEU|nr:DUF4349 domain-containing protein [Saccharothrix variisporea]RKT71937.1 uncharacterized protein DUF4349 [Saccharothrix variisporea]